MIPMWRLLLAWSVICLEMLLLVTLATGGNWTSDVRVFPFDRFAMYGLIALAIVPATFVVRSHSGDSPIGQAVALALYLLWSVSVFLDGNAAGWAHSSSFAEKLVMAGIFSAILIVSLVAPVVLFFIGLVTCLGLRRWFHSSREEDVVEQTHSPEQ